MPTYEYACKSCGEHLEVVQSFKDDPLTTCPTCGGELRKVFGTIGIAFKGLGFYRTDSRPKPKEAKEGAGASSEAGGKSEAKSEAKGEAKGTKGAGKSDSKAAAST